MEITIARGTTNAEAGAARQRGIPLVGVLREHVPLICLMVLQSVVALTTLHNTAFQDEALYLYAGRQIAIALAHHAPLTDPFPTYLSGDPYFYPLVASYLDVWGGLEAARLLSLAAMLGVTFCVYWITQHVFDRESAIFGTTIFAFAGSALFLARLATFDPACLLFIALALALAFRAAQARTPLLTLGIGPLIVLAILDKYAAMLWVPSVILVLAWQTLLRRGWRQALVRVVLGTGSVIATAGLALLVLDDSFLQGMIGSTTNRVITQAAPRAELVWEVVSLGGIGLGLALVGCLLAVRGKRITAWLLLGSALLAPAYHIYKAEPISLDKHIAYALLFAAPAAGYAVARFVRRCRQLTPRNAARDMTAAYHWLPGLSLCMIVFLVGIQQANWQYHMWGNSTNMAYVMRTLVRPEAGHYLAEDMEVARYSLQDVTADWQWTGPFWFEYTNAAGQHFLGTDAYKAALAEGYFDVVELSYGVTAPLDVVLQSALQPGSRYELVAKVPYHDVYGNGYYWIWRKHVPGSSAQLTYAPGPPASASAFQRVRAPGTA